MSTSKHNTTTTPPNPTCALSLIDAVVDIKSYKWAEMKGSAARPGTKPRTVT